MASLRNFEGPVVRDEWAWIDSLKKARSEGVEEPKFQELHQEFITVTTSQGTALRDWRRRFKRAGFRGLYGRHTVFRKRFEGSLLLFRAAQDWRAGLSWAADARFAQSHDQMAGKITSTKIWAGLVPGEAVLGWNMYRAAVEHGAMPVYETRDVPGVGLVTVALDDCAELLVDYTRLREVDEHFSDLVPGQVTCVGELDGLTRVSDREVSVAMAIYAMAGVGK
ncbi:hypothetical protein GTC6_20540 [Gordonia terrae C-6]|uniref:Uncharacterized protein n=2 Tax=Gordonia terrae TaxID=2055 RepID=R7Y556_9ACTN|nr:hypothetical protein GTC6_20540 [Gordonia terrae C-6]